MARGVPVHERSLRTFHLLDALRKETAEINEGWRRGRICIYFAECDAQDLQEIVRWLKAYGDLPPVRNG